ncbi:uncharacterized protein LOC105182099 [Harpegnathos saltator]|uniref:uncharacterized protein LOC105182099 n=1 Tax=Harpegnathos saltator TaxID=610380 RepID=UPI00058E506A|nr:uncharacterized protein LOC105182099 [Harpegnathos saltator]
MNFFLCCYITALPIVVYKCKMTGVLKFASAIIRRISTWLGCESCLEKVPSERTVVHEETCNTNNKGCERCLEKIPSKQTVVHEEICNTNNDDIENEGHLWFKFVSIPWPLYEKLCRENSTTILEDCQHQRVEQIVNRHNIKVPIKPPRKKFETNKHSSTDNPLIKVYDTFDRQMRCPSEKMVESSKKLIMPFDENSDCLPTSNKPQNISRQTVSLKLPKTSANESLLKPYRSSNQ